MTHQPGVYVPLRALFLVNVKMPTIVVGILTFMSRINFRLC